MDNIESMITDSSLEDDENKLVIDENFSTKDKEAKVADKSGYEKVQATFIEKVDGTEKMEVMSSEASTSVKNVGGADIDDLTGTEDHDEDDGTEDPEDLLGGEDGEGGGSVKTRVRQAITGRGVTLAMLMADGVIEAGPGTMSIEYLGQKFTADLLEDGKIRWQEEDKLFSSPSAWAIHCKKIVNPMKKSGCGWASVRYKGKKLDAYKSSWFRKQRIARDSVNGDEECKEFGSDDEGLTARIKEESPDADEQGRAPTVLQERKSSVKHATLGKRSPNHDPNTLVECIPFAALGKMQPFTMSIASNCLLLMDFHCHLTTSEVVGYVAGKWDPTTQHLTIQQAYPCKSRLGDGENAPLVEYEIQQKIDKRGLSMVGWFHSHPRNQPDPSLRDIEAQMEYQSQLNGPDNSYHPCLGIVVSPYDSMTARGKESAFRVFHVLPPPEHRPLEYGMPMSLNYNVSQDMFLSEEVLNEMKALAEFYKEEPDMINFLDIWMSSTTFLDKLNGSLAKKFPRDQTDGRFVEYIHNLLIST